MNSSPRELAEVGSIDKSDLGLAEAKRYQRQKLTASLWSLALHLLVLAGLALLVGPRLDPWLRPLVGENPWLRLIATAFLCAASLELLSLPLDFWSGYILEHRYQLSNQTVRGWIWKRLKGYLIGAPIALLLLLGLYALLWKSGDWWWLWATAGWLAVTLVLGRLLPVVILPLFYKVTRLDDIDLLERLRSLAKDTGLGLEGIYRLHLSAETKKANAALAGLGRTRRVLLGDTLLQEFTPEEIEVVFAHEVGHHVHRHLSKMIAVNVVLSVTGFWLCDVLLKSVAVSLGYPAYDDPTALPLLLLVLMLFGLLMGPAGNALSRVFERQADRYALARTGLPGAYRTAFEKLARMNKADPDPHPLIVWLFEDHPPIRERLALVQTETPASATP